MSVAEKIMSNDKVHLSIVSIEVGYGSTTPVFSANGRHMNFLTMPSRPKQLVDLRYTSQYQNKMAALALLRERLTTISVRSTDLSAKAR